MEHKRTQFICHLSFLASTTTTNNNNKNPEAEFNHKTLNPTPYTLHPTPYTLHPTPSPIPVADFILRLYSFLPS